MHSSYIRDKIKPKFKSHFIMWVQPCLICILVILKEKPFYVQISFFFFFRLELNLELCVFTCIFQINRKFCQNVSYDLVALTYGFEPLLLIVCWPSPNVKAIWLRSYLFWTTYCGVKEFIIILQYAVNLRLICIQYWIGFQGLPASSQHEVFLVSNPSSMELDPFHRLVLWLQGKNAN